MTMLDTLGTTGRHILDAIGGSIGRGAANLAEPDADKTAQRYKDRTENAAASAKAKQLVDDVISRLGVQVPADRRTADIADLTRLIRMGGTPESLAAEYAKAIGGKDITKQGTDILGGITKRAQGEKAAPAGTPDTTGTITPAQQQALIDANVTATLQHKPKANDPKYANDPAAYAADDAEWQTWMQSALKTQQAFHDSAAGITRMQDGTIVTKAQYDALDPVARQQVDAVIADQNAKREQDYSNIVNTLGLKEYDIRRQGALDANTTKIQQQTAANAKTATQIAYDQANTANAAQKVNRSIAGQGENRQRASYITDTLKDAAPMATEAGKTDYSAGDYGGLLEGLAAMAGQRPGATIFRTPGTVHLDPSGLLAGMDTARGVDGPLPGIPDMVTDPSTIAAAPRLEDIPRNAPTLRYPTPPQMVRMPGQQPNGTIIGPGGQVMDMDPAYGLLG